MSKQAILNVTSKYRQLDTLLLKRQGLQTELDQIEDTIRTLIAEMKSDLDGVDITAVKQTLDNIRTK